MVEEKILAYDMKLGFRCKVYDVSRGLLRKISFFANDSYFEAGSREAQTFAKEATRLLFLSLDSESQQSLLSEFNDRLGDEFCIISGDDEDEEDFDENESRH